MLFKCKLSGNLVLWTGSRGGNRLRVSRGHTHALPATVPILALAPAEILCPGNVRTIQTLGQHDTAIRETMQKEEKLFALAILSSSACTLVRCLSYKEFLGKGLVQLRAEARIGVSEVVEDQRKEFSQVKFFNMPDAPIATLEMSEIRKIGANNEGHWQP